MSKHNKHIDRIFQESFKNFEAQPSDQVWSKIQGQIKPKKRRILPIWFKYAGVAASLLFAFGLGYWLQPTPTNQEASFTNLNNDDAKIEVQTELNADFINANELLNQIIDQTAALAENAIFSEFSENSQSSGLSSTENKQLLNQNIASTEANLQDDADASSTESENFILNTITNSFINAVPNYFKFNEGNPSETEITSLENPEDEKRQFDALFEENEIVENTSETNKWFLKPVLSPIFNSGSNASAALGQEVANNASSGDVSFSYGMQVGFKLSNKWSIRTGINQVNTSYTTEDVIFAPAAVAIMPNNGSSVYGVFSQDYYQDNISTPETRIFSQEGSLSQQMNFVEIPLEVEYAILEGKFGINLTGGASTLLLTDNGLIMNTADGRVNIGETQNLNQTSFSTNVGLGLNYQLSKKLKFNVEPALRYQINTFQGSDLSFNPYFFGVYSGLQFQF